MAQAEPEALRLLAPRRGLFAIVESKRKNNSKNAESKTREYSWNCQTSTASPAEPGGLPFRLELKYGKVQDSQSNAQKAIHTARSFDSPGHSPLGICTPPCLLTPFATSSNRYRAMRRRSHT